MLDNIFKFFRIFQISTYLPSVNYGAFIIGVYCLNLLVLAVILDILYVSYSFS
jgi:hypothetical protein